MMNPSLDGIPGIPIFSCTVNPSDQSYIGHSGDANPFELARPVQPQVNTHPQSG